MLRPKSNMRSWIPLVKWCLVFLVSSLTSGLYAKEIVVKGGRLEISFRADEAFVPKAYRARLSEDWSNFCEEFSSLFLIDKGPQGRGLFNKVNCSEVDYTSDPSKIEDPGNSWNYIFSWEKDRFGVTVLYGAKSGKTEIENTVAKIDFPSQLTPDFLFSYKEAKYYVARRIYRQMPMAWSVSLTPQDSQWQLPVLEEQMLGIMQSTQNMGIFGLVYDVDRKSWLPVLYATARSVGVVTESEKKGPKKVAFEVEWVQARKKMPKLWAQELYSPDDKEIDPTFITIRTQEAPVSTGILESYALEGLQTNALWMRYGYPFPKGTTVVSQAPKTEANLQFGKGIMDGFNVSVEYSPRITEEADGEAYSYTWAKSTIGWSFMLGKPQTINRYATRFKLTPRVGLLNLDAYFPLSTEESTDLATTAKFNISSQLDLGGEFSWELEALTYRLKLWGSSNLSGYVFSGTNPTKVSNQRAGADFVYDLWKMGSLQVGGMIFGYIDWVSLQKETEAEEETALTASSTTASGAAYNVTFLGLGMVFVW